MLTYNNKEYRNLQEQVAQNQKDIKYLLEEGRALNEFGIKVVGIVLTQNFLPNPTTYTGEFGDAYAVGARAPYELYIFTRQVSGQTGPFWFNIGLFPAPSTVPGPIGPQGVKGDSGARGSLWYSQTGAPSSPIVMGARTNDQYLDGTNGNVYQCSAGSWILIGNIRGPQGIQGIQGPIGITGPAGPTGPRGPKGDPADPINIAGVLENTNQLPMIDTVPKNTAYLIPDSAGAEHIWLIVGDGTTENPYLWHDAGSFGGGSSILIDGVQQSNVEMQDVINGAANYAIGENTEVSSNGSEVTFSNLQVTGENLGGQQVDLTATIELPIASNTEIETKVVNNTLQLALTDQTWQDIDNLIEAASPQEIQINAPSTSTTGQLTAQQLAALQANKGAYLFFNNEVFRLQDTQHISGYLVYSHLGYENTTQTYVIKCITITISTRGWVLTTRTVPDANQVLQLSKKSSTGFPQDQHIQTPVYFDNNTGNRVVFNSNVIFSLPPALVSANREVELQIYRDDAGYGPVQLYGVQDFRDWSYEFQDVDGDNISFYRTFSLRSESAGATFRYLKISCSKGAILKFLIHSWRSNALKELYFFADRSYNNEDVPGFEAGDILLVIENFTDYEVGDLYIETQVNEE